MLPSTALLCVKWTKLAGFSKGRDVEGLHYLQRNLRTVKRKVWKSICNSHGLLYRHRRQHLLFQHLSYALLLCSTSYPLSIQILDGFKHGFVPILMLYGSICTYFSLHLMSLSTPEWNSLSHISAEHRPFVIPGGSLSLVKADFFTGKESTLGIAREGTWDEDAWRSRD